MPGTHFICPDGQTVPIDECLKNGCRIADMFECKRCLVLPILTVIAQQRDWTGKPSTTQCLNGTREEFLKIRYPFAFSPQSRMFALSGTTMHGKLEEHVPEGYLSELRLHDENASGQFDLYDEINKILYDYKMYGSGKVAKMLGVRKVKVPMTYSDGSPVLYKSGQKKGQQRTKVEFRFDGRRNRFEVALQLNHYRLLIIDKLKKEVYAIFVQIIVRDGGTYIAFSRGVFENAPPPLSIFILSRRWVEKYFTRKANDLINALVEDILPPVCRPRERWGGKRIKQADGTIIETPGMKCERYCDVWQFCELGLLAKENAKKNKKYNGDASDKLAADEGEQDYCD